MMVACIFLVGKIRPQTLREWSEIEMWGSHHVWGETTQGYFSSACRAKARSSLMTLKMNLLSIEVSGVLDSEDQQQAIATLM